MPIIFPEAPPSSSSRKNESSSEKYEGNSSQPPVSLLNPKTNAEPAANQTCRIPIVKLDVEAVTDLIAARLAMSFLGHILFLKSQVPFPVMQLSRIPSGKSSARATKQRTDLLQSFDTLTSHLNTTFTALSTALARCSPRPTQHIANYDPQRVYLAILVGPSMGSARSKVIYAVDGLETKIWGVRNDPVGLEHSEEHDEHPEDSDSEDEESEEDIDSEDDNSSDENDSERHTSGDDSSNDASSPPQSRSPSPPPSTTYSEQQQALNTADRLLSRMLAAADADGHGMATEMSPTQTHILVRAPRRFDHSAWIPRQNISASLDWALDEFLEESGLSVRDEQANRKRKGQKNKIVEGVWITCRDGLIELPPKVEGPQDEENEMIWWSWDGKIVGFSDW